MFKKRRKDKQTLDKIQTALLKAEPGSEEFNTLLGNRSKFSEILDRENSKVGGVSTETLVTTAVTAGVGTTQILMLAKLQDENWMPKNLFNFLSLLKLPAIKIK